MKKPPRKNIKLTPLDERLLLREFVKRHTPQVFEYVKGAAKSFAFLATFFWAQFWFWRDPSKRKAALCTRRAGKSTSVAGILIQAAMNEPFAKCIFVALTRRQARNILWGEIARLNDLYSLGMKPNRTSLTWTLRNGAEIWVCGATDQRDIDRIKGVSFLICAIDEAGSFAEDLLDMLVREVLGPATLDYDGTIMMTGTPTAACAGLFYRATTGAPDKNGKPTPIRTFQRPEKIDVRAIVGPEPLEAAVQAPEALDPDARGWSVHKWTVHENPYVPRKGGRFKTAAEWLLWLCQEEGIDPNSPAFRREYGGEWVKDSNSLVYPDWKDSNVITREEFDKIYAKTRGKGWSWGVSVDLGYDDPCAIATGCWHPDIPEIFVRRLKSSSGMVPAQIAAEILRIRREVAELQGLPMRQNSAGEMVPPEGALAFVVVDQGGGSGKMVSEEFRTIYGIPCVGAQKTHKETYLRFVNGDMRAGRIKIVGEDCDGLPGQLKALQWDPKKPGREDERFANDKADSYLYLCREARIIHFPDLDKEPEEMRPEPGSKEATKRQHDEIRARVEAGLKAKKRKEEEWFK